MLVAAIDQRGAWRWSERRARKDLGVVASRWRVFADLTYRGAVRLGSRWRERWLGVDSEMGTESADLRPVGRPVGEVAGVAVFFRSAYRELLRAAMYAG